MTLYPRITRVRLENFRSIRQCDVALEPLTLLVGPNGSGKSNFLDALGLIGEAVSDSFGAAMQRRGGVRSLLYRAGEEPKTNRFKIEIVFELSPETQGVYTLHPARYDGAFSQETGSYINSERLSLNDTLVFGSGADNVVTGTLNPAPAPSRTRLFLVAASGSPEVRPVYDLLKGLKVYHFDPETIREGRLSLEGEVLERRGHNLAAFLSQNRPFSPGYYDPAEPYYGPFLKAVLPDFGGEVRVVSRADEVLAGYDFGYQRASDKVKFLSSQLSDGTLRLFAVLAALFQRSSPDMNEAVHLVGLEEPELSLHPAAMGPLLDALRTASSIRQVLATTHSPDLLELAQLEPGVEGVLAVGNEGGATAIGEIDEASREAVSEHLFTLGDLLRMRQIEPEPHL